MSRMHRPVVAYGDERPVLAREFRCNTSVFDVSDRLADGFGAVQKTFPAACHPNGIVDVDGFGSAEPQAAEAL